MFFFFRHTIFDPTGFDDKHQHVLMPTSLLTGTAGKFLSHLHDHHREIARAKKAEKGHKIETTSKRTTVIDVLDKFKSKPKRSLDSSYPKIIFKSPIPLKQKTYETAFSDGEEDCQCNREIFAETIAEHSGRSMSTKTDDKIIELNEESSRVRRSSNSNKDKQTEGCSSGTCPLTKNPKHTCTCSQCSCAKSH